MAKLQDGSMQLGVLGQLVTLFRIMQIYIGQTWPALQVVFSVAVFVKGANYGTQHVILHSTMWKAAGRFKTSRVES
jgi:hypothetical protein